MGNIELLRSAIKQGNLAQFKKLIPNLEEEEFLASDENGQTLAHLAAIYDEPEILKILIDKGEEFNNSIFKITNDDNYTPFECCYLYSSFKALSLLQTNPQSGSIANLVLTKQHAPLKALFPRSFRREKIGKISLLASALGDDTALEILYEKALNKEDFLT